MIPQENYTSGVNTLVQDYRVILRYLKDAASLDPDIRDLGRRFANLFYSTRLHEITDKKLLLSILAAESSETMRCLIKQQILKV